MGQREFTAFGRDSRLGRQLAFNIILFSAIITTVLAALQLLADYRKDINYVQSNLSQIETGTIKSITESLWNFDFHVLRIQLSDIVKITDIEYVALDAPNQTMIEFGAMQSKHAIVKKFPLTHDNNGTMNYIGTLTVRASIDQVRHRTWERLWIILGSQALKTFLVSCFMLLLFYRLNTRHLLAIVDFARQYKNYLVPKTLVLDRKPNSRPDEIDIVVSTLNNMWNENSFLYYRIRSQKEQLQAILDNTNAIVFVKEIDGKYILANQKFQTVFNVELDELIGKTDHDIFPQQLADALHAEDRNVIETDVAQESEENHAQADGIHNYMSLRFPLKSPTGETYAVCTVLNDITERVQIEAALFAEKERAQVTLDSIGDAVIRTDMDGRIDYLNPVAEKLTRWCKADAIGLPASEVFKVVNGVMQGAEENPVDRVLQAGTTIILSEQSVLIARDGTHIYIENSGAPIRDLNRKITGVVLIFRDVSATRRMASQLLHQATHDLLTGLPNRRLLLDRFSHASNNARRNNHLLALLFLDLDRFKNVNDSLGHSVGDTLLQQVAERLALCARSSDTISRQGGDEFIVLAEGVSAADDITRLADKIRQALAMPYFVGEQEFTVTSSIGISIFPEDGETFDDIVKSADTAMYRAKAMGRNNFQFFTADMNTRAMERLRLESALRQGMLRGEFLVYYQPKVALATGRIVGVEALLRWKHPTQGMISPATFIPVAEDAGVMTVLGRWVLEEACRQSCAWTDAGLMPVLVAVNLSAAQFRQNAIVEQVAGILRQTGMNAALLELELTESIIMETGDHLSTLQSLKDLGISLSIDDFGTGYSSLSYLRHFPVDTLKIDQAFIRHITYNPDDAAIVDAIIGLGHSLRLKVIAEGVENVEQMEFLRAHSCDQMQGFYFSKPLPAKEFETLLAKTMSPEFS